jgi:ribonuclease HI
MLITNYRATLVANPEEVNIFIDSVVRARPPAASAAAVIKNEIGQILECQTQVLVAMSRAEACYHALLAGLASAQTLRPSQAVFYMSSQELVGQINGNYKIIPEHLKLLHSQVLSIAGQMRADGCRAVEFYYIPEEYNLLAQALATDALLLLPVSKMANMRQFSSDVESIFPVTVYENGDETAS